MSHLSQPKYSSEMKNRAGFSKIKTTLTDLHTALSNLQDKCCNEEEVIATMMKDFKLGGITKMFGEALGRNSDENITFESCEDLTAIRDHVKNQSGAKYLFQTKGSSSTMKITDVRLICDDSVLVKWLRPQMKSVIGYEICVDGNLKSKVRSATRTSAVLFNLNLENEITIEVYAVTPLGLHETQAAAIFRPENDSF